MDDTFDALLASRYVALATFRRDGRAVSTPVWFAEMDSGLYVFTNGDAGKVKRLRLSDRARIARCDIRGRLRGPWFETRAGLVRDARESQRAYRALRRRYGLSMRVADLFSTLAGRMAARRLIRVEMPRADAASTVD